MLGKSMTLICLGGLLACLVCTLAHAQVPMASFLCDQGDGTQVCVAYDDGEVKKVTNLKAKVLSLSWSPDGNYIVYSANPEAESSLICVS